ncbi:hypothetical protein Aperf_G00000073832 [Anoplocephala perfoliata]
MEVAKRAAERVAELQRRRDKAIEELSFRKTELDETRELLSRHRQALNKMRSDKVDDYIWYRYLICDGLPNPIIEKEINTYMSLWRMNEDRITMEDVMIDSINAMKLIDELQTLIVDLDESHSELERYRGVMQELRELVQEKVNRACVDTLTKASHFADPETANLQKYWHNNWLSLCIWGNLSKNPRIKRYTFEQTGITFSIPRLLTVSDCAFRILFMKFDTYSVTSASYKPKLYESPELKIEPKRSRVSSANVVSSFKLTNKSAESEITNAKKIPELNENAEDVGSNLTAEENVIQPGIKTSLNLFDILTEEQDGKKIDEKREAEDVIEEPEEDRIPTPTRPIWEPISLPDDAIDLCNYHVVGGVFQFDLIKLPRQPRMGRGWRWTNCVVPPLLTSLDYVVDTPSVESDDEEVVPDNAEEQQTEGDEIQGRKMEQKEGDQLGRMEGEKNLVASARTANESKGSVDTGAGANVSEPNPPVEVKLRLPRCLIIAEEPVLARWDPENLIWRTNGIVINQFKPELNEISFLTAVFGTFAVFQDFHLNMPFQHWEMRPLPRKILKAGTAIIDAMDTNSVDEDLENLPIDPPATPGTTMMPGRSQKEITQNDQKPPPAPTVSLVPTSQIQMSEVRSTIAASSGPDATPGASSQPQQRAQKPPSTQSRITTLGPLDSMGIPDEVFLADKTEADQCLLTITGAYIRVHLHVLDDRVAVLAEDPKAILDPFKMAEEEAVRAAGITATGPSTPSVGVEDGGADEGGNSATPLTGRRTGPIGGGDGRAGPRFSLAFAGGGFPTAAATACGDENALELQHLTGRWFTPEELTSVLMASGVNLFPRLDSCTRVECIEKNALTEQRLYEQMALLSTVMAFGWSHWNAECRDPNRIILVAAEHIDNSSLVDEKQWKLYSVDRKFVYQLKIAESDEKFSSEPEPTLHKHADFYHMYMEIGSGNGKKRVQEIQSRYFKTVKRILQATRLPVFS